MKTRTGSYPIGFRTLGSAWQGDYSTLIAWSQKNGLEAIDTRRDGHQAGPVLIEAGLRIGSVDLLDWQPMISADKGKRDDAIARNAEYVRACAANGAVNHFIVMLPEDPALPRSENFGYMVESFSALAPTMEECDAHLAIEGYPGPGALCCTPEGCRSFFECCPSPAMGVNYDPSHLIRMGIDPLRFLREFADRVFHVHGKDTELLADNLYEYGSEQPPTFGKTFPFGSMSWRYTIPGHGLTSWVEVFRILAAHDYAGCVCIELEDGNFNGAEDTERLGILQGASFLTGC